MKVLQIVYRNRGVTNVQRGFVLDNEGHKQEAAFAAARILGDPADPREIEFFADLHIDPERISNLSDLKAAILSTYQ